ncbi:MAG: NusG domain II-containing protein [Clostridia bacterium]|nr:NusG domain II-containing protein [Clostridia bacterium]MBQ2948316.1 NusG domain II-containing protein [Clostridia bacterium]MBQ4609408.1 NusG domain II-containing protein [Clostridia bacterium]MBQ6857947.1 NusG domain II-containing protein [Clostridia bacterium]MBQ7051256.1 NusG domain II-containing protein [Clostridia bacterium]
MPKRKDVLLIAAVIAIAAGMLLVSNFMPKTDLSGKTADVTLAPEAVEYIETPAPIAEPTKAPVSVETEAGTAEPSAPEKTEAAGPMPPKKAETVRGHVLLTVGGRQYGDPIPMDRDKIITLQQEDGRINKVHITPEKVYMEFSTCDNQDCVGQGEIHVDTYKDRILGTFVICLPNNVTVEMVPAE